MLHLSPKLLEILASPLGIILGFIFGAFLFWRSSRYELVDSQDIFDVLLLFLVGALFLGRIGDFFVRSGFYKWSFTRLFFFNVFSGFDWYLAFLGGVFAVWFYMKGRRESFWFVFDLAAAPMIFALSFYYAIAYLFLSLAKGFTVGKNGLFLALYFFAVFWIIKRLEKRKRHRGFFACFAITSVVLTDLALGFFPIRRPFNFQISYQLSWGILALIYIVPAWYILAKRRVWNDLKSFFGWVLLFIFKTKRVIFSVTEADGIAKLILLFPFRLVKGVWFLVKLVSREISGGLLDFAHALGVRK